MKETRIYIILLLLLFYEGITHAQNNFSAAERTQQPEAIQVAVADTDAAEEEPVSTYSGSLGSQFDTLANPVLFQTIYEWLGTPYRYSGNSKKGIDCSGFVCMLYRQVYGMELASSSRDIFSRDVKPVKPKNLQTGDLVFFRIQKRRISHVGIYIGNNSFAHASVKQGVVISNLNEPYYKKYFYKAGRISAGNAVTQQEE